MNEVVNKVHSIEVSGVCNLDNYCVWCPMYNRPRSRPRGLMDDNTVARALHWVEKLGTPDSLALHLFGEPLLHKRFFDIAERFRQLVPVNFSTNAMLIDEKKADEIAKYKWDWISVSPWNPERKRRAIALLNERNIRTVEPKGITHDWAGQSDGRKIPLFASCPFLSQGKVSIRWNGDVTTCCITDRVEDVCGTVFQEPEEVKLRSYSICKTCHHQGA